MRSRRHRWRNCSFPPFKFALRRQETGIFRLETGENRAALFTDEYIGIIFMSFIALLLSETGASKIVYLEGEGVGARGSDRGHEP